MTNMISYRTYLGAIAAVLFCQSGFSLPLDNKLKSQSQNLVSIESQRLADRLSTELGSSQNRELLAVAFDRVREYQESQPILVNVSSGDSGFIVCAGVNIGMVILSGEGAICSDLSGRIYALTYSGTGPALNATANVLVGYVQSKNPDLSGMYGGRRGPYDTRLEGSVGGAWLLLGARAIYFTGESKSYIGLAGWELGAGAGATGDATLELSRIK